MSKRANEYRAWERFCHETAARAETDLQRTGLLNAAARCRGEAERLGPKNGPKLLNTAHNQPDKRGSAAPKNSIKSDSAARAITRLSALQNRCSTAELNRLRH
jgi:hypothetical protein